MSGSDPSPIALGPSTSLDQRIARLESSAGQVQQFVQQSAMRTEDQQKSWIATMIIYIFVAVVFFGQAILILRGILSKEANGWEAVTTQSIDLIKSAVLPVVTLVLGYYFGRSGRT
jgi:heme/copper-type cytochrome/quinol oxidase subunit 3